MAIERMSRSGIAHELGLSDEDFYTALEALIEDGTIKVVKEINPKTGELINRYYHQDFDPKGN